MLKKFIIYLWIIRMTALALMMEKYFSKYKNLLGVSGVALKPSGFLLSEIL